MLTADAYVAAEHPDGSAESRPIDPDLPEWDTAVFDRGLADAAGRHRTRAVGFIVGRALIRRKQCTQGPAVHGVPSSAAARGLRRCALATCYAGRRSVGRCCSR